MPARRRRFGATLTSKGVEYGGWFPLDRSVEILVWPEAGLQRVLHTRRLKDGCHRAVDLEGKAGDQYMYQKEGQAPFQDPASSAVTKLHGRSIVVDQTSFQWADAQWQRPAFRDLVIYELHVGTFSPGGTFRGVMERLPFLKDLGINAVELLPIADFPGTRNWGYDGVLPYAPAKSYGSPDDLKAMVDAAHQTGIAVILDVVYNHLGPDGNYLPACSHRFFSERHETPWGQGFNFDGQNAGPVRDFFRENPAYWMEEFHIDGFRLDATHAIVDTSQPHILADLAKEVHAKGGYIVAEDERNDDGMIASPAEGGHDFDAVWADDFHHSVRVAQTGDLSAYFQDFNGTADELLDIMDNGWLYRGQQSAFTGKNRGTECAYLPPSKFIHCISNHDQVGNRAFGDRLSRYVSAEAYRALSALICLTPYTPMLFMGQEWAASTPFQFFTDHNDELGPLVTAGRRSEFSGFPEFNDPDALTSIPDPQDPATFDRSKLKWDEMQEGVHGQVLALYKECLHLRAQHKALRPKSRDGWLASKFGGAVMLEFQDAEGSFLLLINLWEPCNGHLSEVNSSILPPGNWQLVMSSNDPRFGGDNAGFDEAGQSFEFARPEVVLLKAANN